jgi:hypothetical protein
MVVRDGVSAGSGEFLIRPLPAGEYTVEVDDGVNPLWLAEGPRGNAVDLDAGEEIAVSAVVNCDAELSGVVMDDTRSPVADTWVTASLEAKKDGLERPMGATEPPRVLSDADGSFWLRGLCGDQTYRLQASRHDGMVGQRANARPGGSVELVVHASGAVEGTVSWQSGEPVAEYLLTLVHPSAQQTQRISSPDGRFAVAGIPSGVATLAVRAGDRGSRIDVDIQPGEVVRGLKLTLEPVREDALIPDRGRAR